VVEQPFTYSANYGFAYSAQHWVGASCQRPLYPHCRILLQSIHRAAEKKFEISMVWDGNLGPHMSFPVFAAECESADYDRPDRRACVAVDRPCDRQAAVFDDHA
jgi:hypothetical protein